LPIRRHAADPRLDPVTMGTKGPAMTLNRREFVTLSAGLAGTLGARSLFA
jgi:hypothetical protein